MSLYALFCIAAFLVGPEAIIFFPIPIAVYLARRHWGPALGLVVCAGFAALVAAGTAGVVLQCTLVAGLGFPLGLGIARRWTYGWIVAVVAGAAFLIFLLAVLTTWDTWNQQAAAYLDGRLVQAKRAGDSVEPAHFQRMLWLRDHWIDVGFGLLFGIMVIGASVALTVTAWFLRKRFNEPGPRGFFKEMRPPEVLVWLVIVTAALWFFDHRWPHAAVRAVSWNTAVALFMVYSLNGLSLLVYALDLLRPHVMVYIVTGVFLLYFGATILGLVGLFDTWGEFRGKLDRFAAARKLGEGPDGGDS